MSSLSIENVRKEYRQGDRIVAALQGVSLEVKPGQFLAVMGASGSGKSTLLHLMAGLTRADGGHIRIDGTDLGTMDDRSLTLFRRRHIGLVFQSFNLIPTLTAEENILLPLMLESNGHAAASQAKAGALLERLGLAGRRRHRPDAMSGGEQQRVAIGRALVTDPGVILADEPTGNLDSVSSRAVCQFLRDLSVEHGKTIVMVTHEPSVAAYAQDVAVLKDGRLVCQFPADASDGGVALGVRYQECLRQAPVSSAVEVPVPSRVEVP